MNMTERLRHRSITDVLMPPERFGEHGLFVQTQGVARVLACVLMRVKYENRDVGKENDLLMKTASHLLSLDGKVIGDDRLAEIRNTVSDFCIIYFGWIGRGPRQQGKIKQVIEKELGDDLERDKEGVINRVFATLQHIRVRSGRGQFTPVDRAA